MHGTGAAVGDFDGDGMLELLISHGESASETLTYYRARAGADNHWLRILPLTQHGAPARGAVVRMTMAAAIGTAGERVHVRAIDAGSGYLCQMEPVAHFGLGNGVNVLRIIPNAAIKFSCNDTFKAMCVRLLSSRSGSRY